MEQLADIKAWIDFSQGLDIRLACADNIKLLDRLKVECVRFAWDNPNEDLTVYFQQYMRLTEKKKRKRRVYVLTNFNSTHEQDLCRIQTLLGMGFDPYVMVYDKLAAPKITRHLQRWVNNKFIFYSTQHFNEYLKERKCTI